MSTHQIEIATRADAGDLWNKTVDANEQGWWWQRGEWLDYSLEYAPGSTDRSALLAVDQQVALLLPLVVRDRRVQNGGQPFCAPVLIVPGAPMEVISAAGDYAAKWADDNQRVALRPMARLTGVAQAPPGFRRVDKQTNVVDLCRSEPELLRGVRKSYRQAIRKAPASYDLVVSSGPAAVEQARELHLLVAGRETRSRETWRMMGEWAEAGHAFTAVAYTRDRSVDLVGFAYVLRYKGWAYYASGAATRDDVGHALQWEVIKALKGAGDLFYELGHNAAADADEKERGIALFKSGFGSQLWPVAALDYATGERPVGRGGLRRFM